MHSRLNLAEIVDLAELFIEEVERETDAGTEIHLVNLGENSVLIEWIAGRGKNLVQWICAKADKYGVTMSLAVTVYSITDGGKAISHFERHGFGVTHSETESCRDDWPEESEELIDTIHMERPPHKS
jgi:hypothetical protein